MTDDLNTIHVDLKNDMNLLWIDLETTGLDENEGMLLEVAAIVTTPELEEIETFHRVVYQPMIVLNDLDDWIIETHTKNGLLHEVVRSEHRLDTVDRELASFIIRNKESGSKLPLCGSSINFERRWMAKYLPVAYEYIHYRSVDVSSFKEMFKRWAPEIRTPLLVDVLSTHRAMDDIKASIMELSFYRDHADKLLPPVSAATM